MIPIEPVENTTSWVETTMKIQDFQRSLSASEPPPGLSEALIALWWDARGDWDRAHSHAQDDKGADGAWVHAYLHRKEGDRGNAGYWYRQAGRSFCEKSLSEEWQSISQELLAK
jgi:hypothetical protein